MREEDLNKPPRLFRFGPFAIDLKGIDSISIQTGKGDFPSHLVMKSGHVHHLTTACAEAIYKQWCAYRGC